MVRVWRTKSPLFCLRYDPLIVFRRQIHITFNVTWPQCKWPICERQTNVREWSKRANPPYMTLFSWKYFQSIFGSVLYCVVILRTPSTIGRLGWRHVILNLAGNSFHCRSRTASDMKCKLVTTFVDEAKDFYVEKSGQSSCRRAKRSGLLEVRRRKRFGLDENC